MKKKRSALSAFFNLRTLIAFLVCGAAACSLLSGAVLAFFHPEAPSKDSRRNLTFAERVAYLLFKSQYDIVKSPQKFGG
jgi:hypothetical protein